MNDPVLIPALCPSCGALFRSRAIAISGNVKNLVLSGNMETCPYCGNWANIADGVFDVADSVLKVVSSPRITREMLAALEGAVRKALHEKTRPEQLAREVEKIDPELGNLVRASGTGSFRFALLLMILLVIKSCVKLDVKLDVNRLIEQMQKAPPSAIIAADKSVSI